MDSRTSSHLGEVGAGEARRGRLASMPETSVTSVHSDAVASVAVVSPGLCLSGSKDGVRFSCSNTVVIMAMHNAAALV